MGLSVSRRVGGAVERNRVKRVLREAVAAVRAEIRSGQDVVVVARPAVLALAESEGLDGVRRELVDLLARARMLTEEPSAGGETMRRAA